MKYLRLLLLGIVLVAGVAGAFFFPIENLSKSDDGYNIFTIAVSIFPVLFGFSITIIAIVGTLDGTLSSFSWESLSIYQGTFKNKMFRQATLGLAYLLTLILSLCLPQLPKDSIIYFWGGKIFVFLSVTSLLCSFSMPVILYKLLTEKYEQLMREKGAPPL